MNASPGVGEAGPRGDAVRADCWIRVTLRTSGDREIRVRSKVQAMYGRAIAGFLETGADRLKLGRVEIEIEDGGALPYVLAARLEAAARRALPDLDTELLPDTGQDAGAVSAARADARASGSESSPGPTGPRRERLRRSRLYLPGNEPKFMPNAALHAADGLILDLEDSVAPPVKDEARLLVRNALLALSFRGCERMVRINQGARGLEDLRYVVPHGVEMILIPKCESANEVRRVDETASALAKEAGREPPLLMPIVESGRGALRAEEIAAASPRVAALTIGLEDFTADLGAVKSTGGEETFWARSRVVAAARAADAQPIDSVFSDVADMEGLLAWGRRSRALGFVGMGCIHPRQIRVIHQAFAPTAEEIERAARIVEAFEEAKRAGHGVVSLGSKMIDAPVVKRAQEIMRAAERMGVSR